MPANLENSAVATGLEKVNFHSSPKKSNAKECSPYRKIALNSNTLSTSCEELTYWKDPDAGRDWGQEEKGTTEDEMAGWHH